MQTALEEERTRSQEAIEKAVKVWYLVGCAYDCYVKFGRSGVKDEGEKAAVALQAAVEEERNRGNKLSDEQKVRTSNKLSIGMAALYLWCVHENWCIYVLQVM